MQSYAFFDFDKTLVKGDSLFPYLLYLYKHKQIGLMNLWKAGMAALGYAIKAIEAGRAKQIALDFLKYKSAEELALYNRKFLQSLQVFTGAKKRIESLRAEGAKIVLVSASCDVYLQYVQDILDVDVILCTQVQDGIVQKNCKGKEKVHRIEAYLAEVGETIDYAASYAYGDSASDLPMMALVKNRIIVNNNKLFARQKTGEYGFVKWE